MAVIRKFLVGRRFGELLVIQEVDRYICGNHSIRQSLCRCDCGKEKVMMYQTLVDGHAISCGCYNLKRVKTRRKNYDINSSEYRAWVDIKQRCLNSDNGYFSHYGGRGITVYEDWIDDFEKFIDYVGPKPAGCSIDRIDNDGNYEPGNVKWSTPKEQSNNRRISKKYLYEGDYLTIEELSNKVGVNKNTLIGRINSMGWDIEKAVKHPIRGRKE